MVLKSSGVMHPRSRSSFACRSAKEAADTSGGVAATRGADTGGGGGGETVVRRVLNDLLFAKDASAIVAPGDPPDGTPGEAPANVCGVAGTFCEESFPTPHCPPHCPPRRTAPRFAFSISSPSSSRLFFLGSANFQDRSTGRPSAVEGGILRGCVPVAAERVTRVLTAGALSLRFPFPVGVKVGLDLAFGRPGMDLPFAPVTRAFSTSRNAQGSFARSFTDTVARRFPFGKESGGTSLSSSDLFSNPVPTDARAACRFGTDSFYVPTASVSGATVSSSESTHTGSLCSESGGVVLSGVFTGGAEFCVNAFCTPT